MKRIRLIVVMLAALLSVGGLWMVMAQEAEAPAVLPEDPGDGDPEEATDIQIPEYVDATEYLRQATRAMAAKDYGRAFKAFREVLNRWPDLMFKRDTNLYYGIPRYARRMIMSIPPEDLGELGIEEEATARRLLGRGRETFELEPLRTIRDKYFWTRSGAPALELLGDIQLERDHVADAVHSYYQLLQEYRLEKDRRVRVTRKLVVALSDKGDQLFLLKVLKDLVPIAPEVQLSDGTSLVEAKTLLERLSSTTETLMAGDPDGWSEFGGDVSRTGWVPVAVETDVRKWIRTITPLEQKRARSLNAGPGGAPVNIRPMPVPRGMPQVPQPVSGVTGGEFQNHAVVAEGRVMYVEHDRIVALDIDTGNLLWEVGNPFARETPQQVDPRRNMYNRGQGQTRPSHTLTVRGKVLYALRPDGNRFEVLMIDILTGKRLGKVPSRSFQPEFLGAGSIASGIMPYGGRVYVGYSSTQNGGNRGHNNPGFMNEHFVAIDMQDARNPVLLWDTMLYGTSLSRYHINAGGRYDAVHLPTVGGNALYYNSDDGALVSLDTMTGEIRFVYTYEKFVPVRSHGRNPKPTREPPPPCYTAAPLYYNGTVFCAPSEAWDYFALDGATGELKWFYRRKELNFVVGVRKGIVYLTGTRIEARHIETGKLAWETSLSGMKPGGKGVLVGDMLYVPMREESPRGNRDRILRFDAKTGKRLEPINLDPKEHELGNLVMAGKTLLSLNAYRISAFSAWDHQYKLLMARLKDDPNHSPTLFHLGSMYARRQSYERAIDIYKQALQHVAAEQDYQGQPLGDVLKDRLYDFYRDKTRKEFDNKQYDTALATAGETLQYAVTPEQTVETRFTRAMLQEQLTRYDEAALEYQQVKKQYPRVTYQDKQDSEIAAGVYATVEIDRLVKQHGQQAYALVEEEARRLVESGKVENWELVVVEFGPSRARREALLRLADHYFGKDDPKRGARYLKRFVARYPDDSRAPQKAVAAVEAHHVETA
ncbi:MAG: PQQ-binding-like beta-propeller repeat protein, partial [Planctomycetota bacterium]